MTEEPLVGHAEFMLSGEDYDDVSYSWSNEGGNLVYCYYYSGAGKGDYLWIRFAESPDANGDSSPHIDMDVCRFSTDGFGGSFSAEHGIGTLKRETLAQYASPARLGVMRTLKNALDPEGLMNPGKIF